MEPDRTVITGARPRPYPKTTFLSPPSPQSPTLRLLAAFHYVPNQVQAPEAVTGIKLLFSVIPAGLSLAYGLILTLYSINEAMLRRVEGELKARRSGSTRG